MYELNGRTVKAVLSLAKPAQRGDRGTVLLILNVGARWGGLSAPPHDRFTPGKQTRYPLYRRLLGPKGRSGCVRKFWPAPGLEPSTVQSVAGRYPGPLWAKSS